MYPICFFTMLKSKYLHFHHRDPVGGKHISYAKINRHLSTLRSQKHPKSPKTLAEIAVLFKKEHIMKFYGRFIAKRSTRLGMASPCLRRRTSSRHYFADGTFRVVSKGCFQQLYIIHVEYKGHVSLFSIVLVMI